MNLKKKVLSLLCAALMLCGMVLMAPTAFAANQDELQWVELAPMPTARVRHAAVIVGDKLYVMGGYDEGALASVDVYDFMTQTWSAGTPMPTAKYSFDAVALDGKIYVISGMNSSDAYSDSLDIYDTKTDTWSTGAAIPRGRGSFTANDIDGQIYVFGGTTGSYFPNSADIYDPVTDTWGVGRTSSSRYQHASVVINEKLYIMGGMSSPGFQTSSISIYDTIANTWDSTGPNLPGNIIDLSAIATSDKIYAIGGIGNVKGNSGLQETTYIFDVTEGTWSNGPKLNQVRRQFTTVLYNNTIYALGGRETDAALDSMEALVLPGGSITPSSKKLAVLLNIAETVQLSVSDTLSDNANYTWTSSDASVATVDTSGKVTAVGAGTCDITAVSADGSRQVIPVRVFDNGQADAWRLAVTMNVNDKQMLHLTDDPAETTWTSLSPITATVDANGTVTAVSKGLAIVQGTAGTETYQIYVRVMT